MIPRHVIYLDSQDVENYITNGKLNHLYEQLANIGELIGQAEKDILRDIMEEKYTFESGTTLGPESSGQSHRTQKATTEILNQLLRKAGMGADGRDYNLTDAAAIIHYLTGYSYNTIRHYLSSGELSRAQSDEIQDACSLLERLNIQLTIR